MSNYPFAKIYTDNEDVTNVDYVDIDFSSAGFDLVPRVTVTLGENINVFISDLTKGSARINFSTKYTGTVRYTAISMK